MPPDPATARETYTAIIDELVNETSRGVHERLVRESGVYSNGPWHDAMNRFVSSLDKAQRGTLADMLRQERIGAIHDVLALLTWWMECRDVRLTFRGEAMPTGIEGGLHKDFVGRLQDWEWPEDRPRDPLTARRSRSPSPSLSSVPAAATPAR